MFLSLFFDDYGLPSSKVWIFGAIILCIIAVILFVFYDVEDSQLISYFGFGLYLALFCSIASINQYKHIPISGTDIQKANLKRCVFEKTVTLENIENVMTDCQNRDQDLKFKAGIESLGK